MFRFVLADTVRFQLGTEVYRRPLSIHRINLANYNE